MENILEHRLAVQQNIEKGFNGGTNLNEELEKARSGVYEDTAKNRKLNRVGQQYGSKKQETVDEDKKKIAGVSNIIDGFRIQTDKYSDFSKMSLQKTPKGNWRLYYDGKDTGTTLQASAISDANAKKAGLWKEEDDVSSHAANASEGALKRAAADEKAPEDVRNAAKKELEKRGKNGDDKKWKSVFDKMKKVDGNFTEEMYDDLAELAQKHGVDYDEEGEESLKKLPIKEVEKIVDDYSNGEVFEDEKEVENIVKDAFKKLLIAYDKAVSEEGEQDLRAMEKADDEFYKTVGKLISEGKLDKKTFHKIHQSNPSWKYGIDVDWDELERRAKHQNAKRK